MSRRLRPIRVLPLTVLAITAIAPSVAHAGTITGQVVGTPYTSGHTTAVPVLLSRAAAKRAKLASPSGVILVAATRLLAAPGTLLTAAGLEVGDAFTGHTKVPRSERKAAFFRLKSSSLRVTSSSGTPTPASLQAQISTLGAYVAQIATAENRQIAALAAGQQAGSAQLKTLQGLLTTLQKALGGLSSSQIGQMVSDLSSEGQRITTLEQLVGGVNVSALKASVDGVSAQLGTVPSGKTLQGQLDGVNSTVDSLGTGLGAVNTTVGTLSSGLGSLGTTVGSLNTTVGSLGTGLGAVTTTVGTLSSNLGTLGTTVGTLSSSFGTVSNQVGYLCNGSTKLLTGVLNLGLLGIGGTASCP